LKLEILLVLEMPFARLMVDHGEGKYKGNIKYACARHMIIWLTKKKVCYGAWVFTFQTIMGHHSHFDFLNRGIIEISYSKNKK